MSTSNQTVLTATALDYHLQGTSPCADIGDNLLLPSGIKTDLEGNPRILNAIVDLGAYEVRSWIQKFPADKPSGRPYFAMAYDSARGVTVLFGGYDGAYHNDTWEY